MPDTPLSTAYPDLTTIAGLTEADNDVLQRKSGAWANRTLAQLIADLAALATTFQPLDADLTSIAALTTTSFGRSLLALADAAALLSAAGAQASDADLTSWAALTRGTGFDTAVVINVGSAGAFVTFNGALGTPASGAATNMTADGTNLLGYRGVPINSQTAAYSTVLADAGKCIFHPSSDNNARAFTIDGSVAYVVGTVIEFVNLAAASCTIPIGTDTMTLLPAGTTGTRTLAQYGRANAEKVASGTWIISGNSALT